MTRYLIRLFAYLLFFCLAMLAAPVLPLFATPRYGPVNNNGALAIEPRLPRWLFWFDTATDNSLWGDTGWRTRHCPKYWNTYWGMVLWLWRNPACGFAWSVAAHIIETDEAFALRSSGDGLAIDKSTHANGWFTIDSSLGAFQFRWIKTVFGLQLSFESGWLLDVYLKNKSARQDHPRAPFQFQPRLVRVRHT